jgi:rhodanese-related sulfurtransferase
MTAHSYQNLTPSLLAVLGPGGRRSGGREPGECTGARGGLAGAELVPLDTLEAAAASWPREEPLLLLCRSGGRSAQAAQALARRGFRHLYNLVGGMLAVRETPAAHSQG